MVKRVEQTIKKRVCLRSLRKMVKRVRQKGNMFKKIEK